MRATTKLSDAGLDSREIMSVTGHKNEGSLQSYWRPNMNDRKNWSTVLASGSSSAAGVAACPQKRPLPMPEPHESDTPTPPKRSAPENYFNNCTFSGSMSITENPHHKE